MSSEPHSPLSAAPTEHMPPVRPTASAPPAPAVGRWANMGAWIERRALALVIGATVLYALIFSVAAIYKLNAFWMGFDLGTHEQVLWNTAQGRIAAVSMFGTTQSYLGIDIIIIELLLAPIYALFPRTETMLVMQVALAATGAIPLYLLARQYGGSAWHGLLAALLYFAALPVQYAILYEFQIRTVGTVLLLWAFFFYGQCRLALFLLFGILAMWTRSDAGFVLAGMGGYALLQRRSWPWVVLPSVVGVGWVLLSVRVLIPAFRAEQDFLYSLIYRWLGDTPTAMLQTLLTRPVYVAEHVLTAGKLGYLLDLLLPLLFLPLLRPRIVLIATPILLLNLLSLDRIHWSIRYHYQAFIIPFLLIATVYAVIDLERHTRHSRQAWLRQLGRYGLPAALIGVTLASQIWLRSPLINLATRTPNHAHIADAHAMIALVPADAALSATSTLGPHVARREQLYFFPGNVIYPPAIATNGDYILADRNEIPAADQPLFQAVLNSPDWRIVAERGDFILLERVQP